MTAFTLKNNFKKRKLRAFVLEDIYSSQFTTTDTSNSKFEEKEVNTAVPTGQIYSSLLMRQNIQYYIAFKYKN